MTSNVSGIHQLALWGMGSLNTVAWSPDGRRLVIGTDLGVYLYDTQTLQQERFIYMGFSVDLLAVSPDNKTIALVTTKDDTSRVIRWDLETGKNLGEFGSVTKGYFFDLSFSPVGTRLAAAFHKKDTSYAMLWYEAVIVWEIKDGKNLFQGIVECDPLDFAFVDSGRSLIYSGCQTAYQVNLATADREEVERSFLNDLLRTSPNGRWQLGEVDWNPDMGTWGSWLTDRQAGSKPLVFLPECRYSRQPFRPDSRSLTCFTEEKITIWSLDTLEEERSLSWDPLPLSLSFGLLHVDDQEVNGLIVGTANGIVRFYSTDPPEFLFELNLAAEAGLSDTRSTAIALSPDGHLLAVVLEGGNQKSLVIYNLNTQNIELSLNVTENNDYESEIIALSFSEDNTAVLAKRETGYGRGWYLENGLVMPNPSEKTWYQGQPVGTDLQGHLIQLELDEITKSFTAVDLHTDQVLGVGLSYETGNPYDTFVCQASAGQLILSADRRFGAQGCDSTKLPVWKLATGTRKELTGHIPSFPASSGPPLNILDSAFGPYGYLIVTAGVDDTIRFWDAAAGTLLMTLGDHTCNVQRVLFSTDGRYLASSSCDGTVRLWGLLP